ncbi:heme-binding protein [Frondihabitans sp. 4ASC-45]|uniref:heme-binding protein n=1 Tax=Frondihabitans sp. 4ASC-45 TaxID=3111636 RepID=UPI003C27EFEC
MTDAPLPECPLTETDLPEFTPDEVRAQLAELTFDSVGSFDQEAAYSLGTLAAEIVRERGFALAVQVVLGEHIVYKAALGGVSADTTSWLRRKSNVALRDAQPSLLTRLEADASGTPHQIDDEFAVSGGSFPIVVDGSVVGTITASGLKDVIDHDLVVTAIRSYLAN